MLKEPRKLRQATLFQHSLDLLAIQLRGGPRGLPWMPAMKAMWIVMVASMLWPSQAYASKGCWCWIGIEKGQKLIEYGSVATFRDIESGKKRKCSNACSKRCASDLNNPAKLCSAIGGDYTYTGTIGCFSVVGAKDSPNNTWDYDGRPTNFQGCSTCCTCPEGWYDKNRKSCVTGVSCQVPGMPNGDKGGGYFAWDEKLFMNIPGAKCTVETGVDACSPGGSNKWTRWFDVDDPYGAGDYELLSNLQKTGQACAKPTGIECQTLKGKDWSQTDQVYTCKPEMGGVCRNKDQDRNKRCDDYRVRFLCPE